MVADVLELLPGVCCATENLSDPHHARGSDVVFHFLAGFGLDVGSEDGVGEAGCIADTFEKGYVCLVEVPGTPGEGPSVESYDEGCVAGFFGAA